MLTSINSLGICGCMFCTLREELNYQLSPHDVELDQVAGEDAGHTWHTQTYSVDWGRLVEVQEIFNSQFNSSRLGTMFCTSIAEAAARSTGCRTNHLAGYAGHCRTV